MQARPLEPRRPLVGSFTNGYGASAGFRRRQQLTSESKLGKRTTKANGGGDDDDSDALWVGEWQLKGGWKFFSGEAMAKYI
jgi:hypothetical protein